MSSTFGRYTHAIVSRVPANFGSDCGGVAGVIDPLLAQKQHESLVRTLRQLQVDVIELPADPAHPRSPLVGECAVVCNGIALLCRPAVESRWPEVEAIKAVIKKDLELPFVEIPDTSARLDGGDVLFTGREFFVGVSSRTDEAGASAVAAAFPEYSCTPIMVPRGVASLQTLVTMAAPDILCVSETNDAQTVLKRIEREATFRYNTLTVPDADAANCLYVNGALLHRHGDECPAANKVFQTRLNVSLRPHHYGQVCRAGGSLTTSCVLIRKSKWFQI